MSMAYREAVAYLYGLQKHGMKPGLEVIEALLGRLGRPHRRYPSLHIGGTNGKGSTAAMAASILQAAGYRVGLYTSPHLVDYRERIRVNGELSHEAQIVELVRAVREASGATLSPTFFEFNTAMAFQAFAEVHVDVAVVEVGMGGRCDATNVLDPIVSAVTTVALDHQDQLGHTIEAIACEKAGIIKAKIPVVTGRLNPLADPVIERAAQARHAPRLRLGQEFWAEGASNDNFSYHSLVRTLSALSIPLAGAHQMENAACAVALIEAAAAKGLPVPENAIRQGLHVAQWEGRLEVVERDPLVILDGAHNPAAAEVVVRYLTDVRRRQPGLHVHLVVGMMRDKDMAGVLARLSAAADSLTLTHMDLPRAATLQELQAALPSGAPTVETAPTVTEALERAKRRAAPSDVVCVTGSLMLVGAVKAWLRGCRLSPISG